jgi:hypothetical protein
MFRKIDLAMVAVMVGVVTYTYTVKNTAKEAGETLAAIQREQEAEANAIDLLQADWQVLTAPKRLQSLVEVYGAELGLQPLDAKRYVSIADIPPRPEAPQAEASIDDILARYGDVDPGIMTGSVSSDPAAVTPQDLPVPQAAPRSDDVGAVIEEGAPMSGADQ